MLLRAFTLIELLVVITIIVVLLALLMPSMNKAVYQAELATCGANLHGIVNGALTYAMGSRRAYPVRVAIQGNSNWSPAMIYNGNEAFRAYWSALSQGLNVNNDIYDDRPVLRQFISLRSLVDPLTGKVDYEDTHDDSNAFSSISLWFGFGLKGQKGLDRIGDRWNVLANYKYQNTDFRKTAGFKTVATLWEVTNNPWRGLTDLNFGRADGSVSRHIGVEYKDGQMVKPPYYNTIPGWWAILPRP
jgi:prepilin-type N-terminal cleavage/methylation domain-containing protein